MCVMYDLVIRRARLVDREGVYDIAISNGVVELVSRHVSERGVEEIDAGGGLVTPVFVNPHLHLCKVYTFEMIGGDALKYYHGGGMGSSIRAIELASKVKEKYDEKWIIANVRRALKEALRFGTLYIRGFADVDSKARLEGVKALLKAKEEFKEYISLQVVAFPQDGIVREPGAEELLYKAVELGADIVGGIPWIEDSDEDEWKHIEVAFNIAKEYNRDVAMLVDDAGDPTLRTTEKLAKATLKHRWINRVTAHHARAMALYPDTYTRKLARQLRKAGISVIVDPHTGPLHARVDLLLEENVNVALGQDDIVDAYYPYGRNNMLEVAFLASHIMWWTTPDKIKIIYDMITWRAAKAMGLKDYCRRVMEGCKADLLVHGYPTLRELLLNHEAPRYVIKNGKVIVENKYITEMKSSANTKRNL